MLRDLVEYLVRMLVDSPDEVQVREVFGERQTTIEVTVAQRDLGRVIGKHGRIANAIRSFAGAAAAKEGRRVHVDILAP